MIKVDLKEIIGEVNTNNSGERMTIIGYKNANNIDVEFEDGNIIHGARHGNFKTGNIKNYLKPIVFNRGFYGDTKSNKRDYIYCIWFRMMERCYSDSQIIKDKFPRYNGICSVNKEWWNYQNFKKWYYDNLWFESDMKSNVDKDILIKGNKEYSPKNCIVVPCEINNLFVKSDKVRGKYPIGVAKGCGTSKKFRAYCNHMVNGNKKQKSLGVYSTPNEAFLAYKSFKESYIKQVADEYKSKYPNFPQKLYDAMYSYEVEITD